MYIPSSTQLRASILIALTGKATIASAAERSLAETAIIGGAQGVIMGVALLIFFFVWKPLKKRLDEAKQTRAIIENKLTPLMVAAAQGNDAEVTRLIAEGADLNARGKSGETALMLAAKNDKRSTVRLLLQGGADISAKTMKGNSAVDIAKQNNRLYVVDIISAEMDKEAQ